MASKKNKKSKGELALYLKKIKINSPAKSKKNSEEKKPEANSEKEAEKNLEENKKPEEEKEAEFVAPVLTPSQSRVFLNPLEQTASEIPNSPAREIEETGYSAKSAYLNAGEYISNQKYRSGDSKYDSRDFKPELARPNLDRPIFNTRGFESRAQERSAEREKAHEKEGQPVIMSKYEIKHEETSHHGRRKQKTEIF